ncbi:MAG: hypothetical protein H6683_09660 [Deltaproteobacteria bacterium]|nr:hypothetical protein [Deltaproteobacteria bacterium]
MTMRRRNRRPVCPSRPQWRPRRVGVGLAASLTLALFTAACAVALKGDNLRAVTTPTADPCVEAVARLERVWTPKAKAAVHRASSVGADAAGEIDRLTDSWKAQTAAECREREFAATTTESPVGESSAMGPARACLSSARVSIAMLVDIADDAESAALLTADNLTIITTHLRSKLSSCERNGDGQFAGAGTNPPTWSEAVQAHLARAELALMMGDTTAANDAATHALSADDTIQRARAHLLIAQAAFAKAGANTSAVEDSAAESLRLATDADDEIGQADALVMIGRTRHARGDYTAAGDAFLQALTIYHTHLPTDDPRIAAVHRAVAVNHDALFAAR